MMRSGKLKPLFTVLILLATVPLASADAKVIKIKPEVFASASSTSQRILKRGDDIFVQDTIRTDARGKGVFRFIDGTLLTLGSNSTMQVTDFVFNAQEKHALFEFTKGVFRMITGSITQTSTPNFTVKTPMGAIGVRGTDFWGGNLTDNNSIDVVLLASDHSIEVSNQFGKVRLTISGQGTTLRPKQAPLAPTIWPKEKLQRAFKTVATD